MDSLNRVALDSLYELYGFPSKKALGGRKSSVPWFVLQHSTDCDWIEKWIGYYLDARLENKGNINVPLNATFIRFFHPETGFCENRKAFIQYLKKNYPADFAEKFGYKDFD